MLPVFTNRHVAVTGGTGALGAAIVGPLLEAGAIVHVPCLDVHELRTFEYKDHDRIRVVTGIDLTNEDAASGFFGRLPELWASIHAAGGFAMHAITDTSLAEFRRLFEMNATTCFLSCREAVKKMRASGRGGRIVNVTARPALLPAGGMVAYTTAKAAVASLTQCLAEELREEQIWVNAVVPSIMDTPANRRAMPDANHNRWPTVTDVAATVLFLASPDNAVTRGALVPVYGPN